jgi:drug/metabolite transporter (DMT)-like permease
MQSLLLFICIMCWGSYFIFMKIALQHMRIFHFHIIFSIFNLLLIPVMVFLLHKIPSQQTFHWHGTIYAVIAIFLTCTGSYVIEYLIGTYGHAGKFTAISSIYPLVTIILSFLVFKETFTPLQISGMFVTLFGLYLINT